MDIFYRHLKQNIVKFINKKENVMWFVYNRFKLRKWGKYSSSKRLKVLQALEEKMAKKNHREPVNVVVHERSDWNCLGMFTTSGDSKKIYIHENLILNPSYRFHALETIIHEGRHATQYEIINNGKLKWWQFTAKRWKNNFHSYVSSSEDRVLYNNQEVERDAQKYTIKWLRKLSYKYKNEKDFQNTLRRNEYRYENAENEARKKYGLFYKSKMRKKIEKRNKY